MPDAALDRTVNMLFLPIGPGGFSLVVSRGRLRDQESIDAFVDREWELATRTAKDLTVQTRRSVTAGRAECPGVQTESTHEQDGRTFHQHQTAFRLDAGGQVIVMTLTSAAPLSDEQRAIANRMLESFQLRPQGPAAPSLVSDSPRP
ncbi:DcrB-related protein [Burkholderia pseudomallei]|nr:DcrB-related protein [Burkholderia pseudomallei]